MIFKAIVFDLTPCRQGVFSSVFNEKRRTQVAIDRENCASFLCRFSPPLILNCGHPPATIHCLAVILFSVSHFTSIATRIFYTVIMEQQLDLTKLSESDKKELNQVLTNEAQKSNIQQSKCPSLYSDILRIYTLSSIRSGF